MPKTERLQVKVDTELKKILELEAQKKGMSVSTLVRTILLEKMNSDK